MLQVFGWEMTLLRMYVLRVVWTMLCGTIRGLNTATPLCMSVMQRLGLRAINLTLWVCVRDEQSDSGWLLSRTELFYGRQSLAIKCLIADPLSLSVFISVMIWSVVVRILTLLIKVG